MVKKKPTREDIKVRSTRRAHRKICQRLSIEDPAHICSQHHIKVPAHCRLKRGKKKRYARSTNKLEQPKEPPPPPKEAYPLSLLQSTVSQHLTSGPVWATTPNSN